MAALKDVCAIAASRQVALNAVRLQQVVDQLDAGEGGRVSSLEGAIRAAVQGRRNAKEGKGCLQVARTVLREVKNLLVRASELSREAQGESTGEVRRLELEAEFREINRIIGDIGFNTKINGINIFGADLNLALGGFGSMEIHVDAIDPEGERVLGPGLGALTVASPANAAAAETAIEAALKRVVEARADLGESVRRLKAVANVLGIQAESMAAARSRVLNAQRATEVVNLVKWQLVHLASAGEPEQTNQIKLLRRRILPPL